MVLFQIYTTNQLVSQRQTIFDILLMTAVEILSNHSRYVLVIIMLFI